MGLTTPINFAVNSYKARSGLMSSERLLNMYAELNPEESPFRVSLYGTPGVDIWTLLDNYQPIYGMQVMGENLYVVCGVSVYKINSTKTMTLLGTIGTTPGRVMMTENGTQVTILTENGTAYYATTSTVEQITDEDYQLANSVTTLDGYSIFTKKESTQFFISAIRDTTSYSALDFASAEAESDDLVTVLSYNRQLILLGTRSIEIWYNSGNPTFPFERVDGVLIKRGVIGKYAAISDMTGVYWQGDDKIIYNASNYTPQRISTHAVEKAIQSYETIDDAFFGIYTQEGHKFLCITYPTAQKTWVYDITTRLWHERSSLNPVTRQQQAWLPNCYANFFEQSLVGDTNTGTIYELDLDTYTENGTPIIAEMISATQFSNFDRNTFDRLTFMMETGVGIDGSGQGTSPQIMLDWSNDGAKTWSNEAWQEIGDIGQYETEVFWTGLGWGRSLIVRARISDPVKRALIGAYLNTTEGAS